MNGVDVIDQLVGQYDREGRNNKWTLPYIDTSLKMGLATAYKLYSVYVTEINKTKADDDRIIAYDHRIFNQEVAKSLVKKPTVENSSVFGTSELNTPIDIREIHFKKKHVKTGKCRAKGCPNSSYYSCGACTRNKKPLYYCGPHLKDHQEAEERLMML